MLKNENWESRYAELVEFKKTHGHLRVPVISGGLSEWISSQKTLKAEGKLQKDREIKLIKIDFIWKGEIEKQMISVWESMYNRFKLLKETHGTKYVLMLSQRPDLNKWANDQVKNKKKLSAFKKDKLNEINFSWNRTKNYWDERWNIMYLELVAYKNKFGHCDVPQSPKEKEYKKLAVWVNGQRGKVLNGARKEKLDSLGFSWANTIVERRWFERVKEFKDLKKEGKHLQIHHPTPLASWIYQQKKNFQKLLDYKKKILIEEGIV